MIYPINIFTPDPVSGNIRPFIIFVAQEIMFNFKKVQSLKDFIKDGTPPIPRGGFVLPMPSGGLIDGVSNDFGPTPNSITGTFAEALKGKSIMGVNIANVISDKTGMVIDPWMTNIYKGSTPRVWNGEWEFLPQSVAESLAVAALLMKLKKWSAPQRHKGGLPIMKQPYVWKIIFANPYLQIMTNYNTMSLTSYSINYFADGYAATYMDGMPKHLSLSMSFAEFGIKYQDQWI